MRSVYMDVEAGLAWAWKEENMLISQDLMRHLARFVEPPAQLCLIRVLGSDHEYVFRVRYGDVHLDYPCVVPLYNSASKVEELCNWDEVARFCAVASAMVVPPAARVEHSSTYRYTPLSPQVLAPMSPELFRCWDMS